MLRYLPLICAILFAAIMVIARLLTNRHVRQHSGEIVAAGTPVGHIPPLLSTVYLVGLVGLIATFFWSFISVGWWAGVIVVGLYLLTGLVRSLLS